MASSSRIEDLVAPSPSNQMIRVLELFYAPIRLFKEVIHYQNWWLPYLLTVICSCTLTFSAAHKLGFRAMAINTLRSDPVASARFDEDMSPEQQAATLASLENTYRISAYSTPLLVLLFNVVYALTLLLCLTVTGGKTSFSSIFTVLLYSDLVLDLRSLLATVALYLTPDGEGFNIQNPIGSNIGYFLDSTVVPWLKTLCESIDVFTLWYLALIALGCSIVARLRLKVTASIIASLWLMIVTIRVLWAAIR